MIWFLVYLLANVIAGMAIWPDYAGRCIRSYGTVTGYDAVAFVVICAVAAAPLLLCATVFVGWRFVTGKD